MLESAVRLLDPVSMLIVFGGTAAVTAMRSTGAELRAAIRALAPLIRSRPAADARAAERAVLQIKRISDIRGIAVADRVDTSSLFVRAAAVQLANAPDAEAFRIWADEEMKAREARHEGALAVWRGAADVAPSMGMIGTILGLIGMFAAMDDTARMGGAMAVALLTTLYGLILSAAVAGPIAARLERLSLAERRWQQFALDRLEALARSEAKGVLRYPVRTGAGA